MIFLERMCKNITLIYLLARKIRYHKQIYLVSLEITKKCMTSENMIYTMSLTMTLKVLLSLDMMIWSNFMDFSIISFTLQFQINFICELFCLAFFLLLVLLGKLGISVMPRNIE